MTEPPATAASISAPGPAPSSGTSGVRATVWSVLALAAAGLVSGLAWVALATPATYIVTADNAFLDEQGLADVFNADGWFLVLGLALGLVVGGTAVYAFRRQGWVVVLAVLLGSCLASYLSYLVGHALGPGSLDERLRSAAPGDRVAVPLAVRASGVYLSWPVGAMLGALAAVFAWDRNEPDASAPGHAVR